MQDYFDINTVIYGLVIDVISMINDYIITILVSKRNFRFKSDHESALYFQLFLF